MNSVKTVKSYVTSIDGLRGLAILFVLAYHFQLPFARGGFIGVDIFFVLSGYLITSLLLLEWRNTQRIDFKHFWIKRLRRLFPAVTAIILSVFIITFLFFPSVFHKVRGDGLASFFYMSNWWYIFQKIPYFDSLGTPSPLKHLWSLAIEVQFYLIWPPILYGLLKWLKKRQKVLVAIIIGIVASLCAMLLLYTPQSIDRVYYGTDTRLFTILIGAALAFLWPYYVLEDNLSVKSRRILDSIGGISLVGLIILSMVLNEFQPFVYPWGMLLVAILTACLLAVLVHPSSQLAKYFSFRPFKWIGQRSYSLYLWHYPVVALTTPIKSIGRIHPLLILLQLCLFVLLAECSYRFLEEPIRKRGIVPWFKELRHLSKKQIRTGVIALVLAFFLFGSLVAYQAVLINPKPSEEVKPKPVEEKPVEKKIVIGQSLVIGDSVILGAKEKIEERLPKVRVDALIGRQLVDAKKLIEKDYGSFNTKDSLIILELGSNSPFSTNELDDLLNLFDKVHVLLVNTRVPRNWEREVNVKLAEAAKNHNNVSLVDWYSHAIENMNYLEEDGIHLTEAGKDAYVNLLFEAMSKFELPAKE